MAMKSKTFVVFESKMTKKNVTTVALEEVNFHSYTYLISCFSWLLSFKNFYNCDRLMAVEGMSF